MACAKNSAVDSPREVISFSRVTRKTPNRATKMATDVTTVERIKNKGYFRVTLKPERPLLAYLYLRISPYLQRLVVLPRTR